MLTLDALVRRMDLGLEVVAGSAALDREVRWVHVTELPDPRPYVGDGELVATNGLWLAHCSAAAFVRRLRGSGMVGLAFGLREDLGRVPDGLSEACRDEGLPLLAVPPSLPFTALTRAVAVAQMEERRVSLLTVVRRNDELAASLASGGGMRGLIGLLGGRQAVPAALVDRFGRIPASTFGELPEHSALTVAEALNSGADDAEVVLADGTRCLLMAVPDFGRPELALLYGRAPEAVTAAERDAIDQALRFLSVESAQRRAVRAVEARFAGEVVDMILDGAARTGELVSRLRSFGIDTRMALQVFCIADVQEEGAESAVLEELVGEVMLDRGLPCVVCPAEGETVAVVGVQGSSAHAREIAADVLGALRARLPQRRHVAGVGRAAADGRGLRSSLLQAREARRLAQAGQHEDGVAMFTKSSSYRLMISLLDEETRREFAHSVLEPIAAWDREHGSDLQHTLQVFFRNRESWKLTAAQLHVHVNTLRNRLDRIEQLSGRALGDVGDRTDLFLALEILGGP